MTTAVVVAGVDRAIPATYVGTVEPNWFCRGWNPRRTKYCSARAGWGTDHPGSGRCKFHGGRNVARHGQRRRYSGMQAPRLQDLIAQYQSDPEPLDVLADLAVARALMHDWLERYATFTAALTAWHDTSLSAEPQPKPRQLLDVSDAMRHVDTISRVITRAEQVRAHGTISLDRVRLFLFAIDRGLELEVSDVALRDRIRRMIFAIRV